MLYIKIAFFYRTAYTLVLVTVCVVFNSVGLLQNVLVQFLLLSVNNI